MKKLPHVSLHSLPALADLFRADNWFNTRRTKER